MATRLEHLSKLNPEQLRAAVHGVGPGLAAEIGSQSDHVLADEYQDSNRLRATILRISAATFSRPMTLSSARSRSRSIRLRWPGLFEHRFAFYKWNLCRVGGSYAGIWVSRKEGVARLERGPDTGCEFFRRPQAAGLG